MAQRAEQHRLGFQRQDIRRPQRVRLGDAKAPGGAGQQHPPMRTQHVGQRRQGRRGIAGPRLALGKRREAVAVAVEAEALRRIGRPSMPALLEMSVSTRSVKSSSRA